MTCLVRTRHPARNHQPSAASNSLDTTILLVEPDSQNRQIVSLGLEQEGYRVMQVADGQRALEWVTYGYYNIELLILETALPQLNGLELCQLLRQQGQSLPILMISGQTSETDRVLGLELGADDYLSKPFSLSELVARCRVLLRYWSRAKPTPAKLRYGDLVLDSNLHTVTLRDQLISLSPKEFRLLELLMQYPKRVWQREQLLNSIWGTDYAGDSRTVDTHIRWLRKKIEQDPGQPDYIKTVRGFGYRLG